MNDEDEISGIGSCIFLLENWVFLVGLYASGVVGSKSNMVKHIFFWIKNQWPFLRNAWLKLKTVSRFHLIIGLLITSFFT